MPISETLQEKVALAFYFKSAIFRDLNKLDDEIANYQEFINFFHRESTHATEKLQEIFSKIEKLRNIALEKKKAK